MVVSAVNDVVVGAVLEDGGSLGSNAGEACEEWKVVVVADEAVKVWVCYWDPTADWEDVVVGFSER